MSTPTSNFAFLDPVSPALAELGRRAERYFQDPRVCLFELRSFGELVVKEACHRLERSIGPADNFFTLTVKLRESGATDEQTADRLHKIRMTGNGAVHANTASLQEAANHLGYARNVAIWFARRFHDATLRPPPFKVPNGGLELDARQRLLEQQLAAERAELARTKADLETVLERLDEPQVAFHASLQEALGRLPDALRGEVESALEAFSDAPRELLDKAVACAGSDDDKLFMSPLGGDIALVFVRGPRGDVVIAVWVGTPDECLGWVAGKRFEVHPRLGSLQVFDVAEVARNAPAAPSTATVQYLAASDEQLVELGLPPVLLPAVRALHGDADLDKLAPHLPPEAADALFLLAAGYDFAGTVSELARAQPRQPVAADDLAVAVQHPESQRSFKLLEPDERLAQALSGSLEAWRVFLHPTQKRVVRMNANGPVRVLGGAGTGKTVALLHRAAYLATEILRESHQRILVTTFTRNLASNLKRLLASMVPPEAMARIDVTNLHSRAVELMRQQQRTYKIAGGADERVLWQEAMRAETVKLPQVFYTDEWKRVVQAQDIADQAGYEQADRRGRGRALKNRKERQQVWAVLAAYRAALDSRGLVEFADVVRDARHALASCAVAPPYSAVLSDEVQDLGPGELRFLRLLAAPGKNDLFLVGDAHQRIYGNVAKLSACGIDARGARCTRLRLNYRTTQEISRFAVSLLGEAPADDLDGGSDTLAGYRAARSGASPRVASFASLEAEVDFVAALLTTWLATRSGSPPIAPESICVAVRTNDLRKTWSEQLTRRSLTVAILKEDEAPGPGVRLATMHRMKGLEFERVILASVQAGTLPQPFAGQSQADDTSRAQHIQSERCLLYVAATRARDELIITGHGAASPLLPARERPDGPGHRAP